MFWPNSILQHADKIKPGISTRSSRIHETKMTIQLIESQGQLIKNVTQLIEYLQPIE